MAIDVLLNLVIVLMMVGGAIWAWRKLTRDERAGPVRCPTCGYDVRESPEVCPECGEPVPEPLKLRALLARGTPPAWMTDDAEPPEPRPPDEGEPFVPLVWQDDPAEHELLLDLLARAGIAVEVGLQIVPHHPVGLGKPAPQKTRYEVNVLAGDMAMASEILYHLRRSRAEAAASADSPQP